MSSRLCWLAFTAAVVVTLLCFRGCDMVSAVNHQAQKVFVVEGLTTAFS